MNIKWYGHSCFLLTSANGVRVLCDPYSPEVGTNLEDIEADIVTVSHHHFDHDCISVVGGEYILVDKCERIEHEGIIIEGINTFHDTEGGAKRGTNIMFKITMDGMSVLHCGDLGHTLDAETIERVGNVDVLLVPIGGTYTLDYIGARAVANQLKQKVVIPMHYKTPNCKLDELAPIDAFISHVANCAIHRLNQSEASLYPATLGEDRVLVLNC